MKLASGSFVDSGARIVATLGQSPSANQNAASSEYFSHQRACFENQAAVRNRRNVVPSQFFVLLGQLLEICKRCNRNVGKLCSGYYNFARWIDVSLCGFLVSCFHHTTMCEKTVEGRQASRIVL